MVTHEVLIELTREHSGEWGVILSPQEMTHPGIAGLHIMETNE